MWVYNILKKTPVSRDSDILKYWGECRLTQPPWKPICIQTLTNVLALFLKIYLRLCWVFIAARGLSLVAASGGYSSLRCASFSWRWLLLLQSTGSRHTRASVVVAHRFSSCGLWALECRLSSLGAQAQLLCGMCDLPGPGLEPVSPALAGRLLTTALPGKTCPGSFIWEFRFGKSSLKE